MKSFFVSILVMSQVLTLSAQGVCEPPIYYFNSKSNSGNGSLGSNYTFSNVLSSTDAVITITKLQNASISNSFMDVNSSYPVAWQPFITFPSSRSNSSDSSYIEFKVEFKSNVNNSLINQSCMAMTIVDCDGNGSNNGYREFAKVSLPGTPTGISGSSISVYDDAKWMLFKSGATVFNNIDTNNLAAMGQFNFPSTTNTFYMRVGVIGPVSANTQRQFSFYFKSFGLVVPLPVKLLKLDVENVKEKVELNWAVTDEAELSHFEIYRSVDGEQFESIGTVNSSNQEGISEYSYTDAGIYNSERLYYKLKLIGRNGASTWSHVKLVVLNAIEKGPLAIYPTPSNGTLGIRSEVEAEVNIHIMDAYGKVVYEGRHAIGETPLSLDFKHLVNGMYTIQITDEQEFVSTFKWMKTSR